MFYTIIAGINGAGKTSLYEAIRGEKGLGVRINTDEMVRDWGGDWRDTLVQIKAGRRAMELIDDCIDHGVPFHQETTLPGATILKYVKKAKANGFEIRLFFVGIDSLELALERVHRRVEQGGHGIEDSVVARRFKAMPANLLALLPLVDYAVFYDNTTRFRQFAIIINGEIVDIDTDVPEWFTKIKGAFN